MRVRHLLLFAALLITYAGSPVPPHRPPDTVTGTTTGAASGLAPGPVVVARRVPGTEAARALPPAERRALDRALGRYLRERPGRAALAVYDRMTGIRYAFRERVPFLLASVAKVDILLAFLLGKGGEPLSGHERELASRMIRHSDNDCARDLYLTIGGREGLDRMLRQVGARHTRPGAGTSWGITHSRPSDQVRILEQLTDPEGPLTARSRHYAMELMSSVEPAQSWGVSAAAPEGETALKNGWLPADAHDGLWTVNSVGRLQVHGHELLLAVLSERSPDLETGVTTGEGLARLAADALTRPGDAAVLGRWPTAAGALTAEPGLPEGPPAGQEAQQPPPQQPPPPPAFGAAAPPVMATVDSSLTVSPWPSGHVAGSSEADMGRDTSNVEPQARQRKS
ncbi:hypothetical protein GCM10009733_048310 [Nonomuraea maheshkhaliensis]|uniref:Beta-lactamase class A catalytic domain-containing protein n=1 Tax=Nonomuraea maheshkhaliensis TaxID=419590 RepID=A0ABP4REG5_9ACTN